MAKVLAWLKGEKHWSDFGRRDMVVLTIFSVMPAFVFTLSDSGLHAELL